jgi:hypothetical protein
MKWTHEKKLIHFFNWIEDVMHDCYDTIRRIEDEDCVKQTLRPSLQLPSIRPRHSLCCSADQLSWPSEASTCIWELQRLTTFTSTLRNHSCKWTRHNTPRTTVQTRRVYDRLRVTTFTNTLRNHSCKWTRHDTRRTTVQTRRVYDRLQLCRWWWYSLGTENRTGFYSLAHSFRSSEH